MASVQTLSAKSTRRLAREMDEPTITRAWVNNGTDHHVVLFATWDHAHGCYNRRTGEWHYDDPEDDGPHLTSCYGDGQVLLLDLDPFDDDGRWPTLG